LQIDKSKKILSVTISPFVDLQNTHGCIDITYDVDFTQKLFPFLEIEQKGAIKEFISI
jgi:hypothetical protein